MASNSECCSEHEKGDYNREENGILLAKGLKPTGWEQHQKLENGTLFPVNLGTNASFDFTAFNAGHQHATVLCNKTHTAGEVHFLSGNEHVFFFLEPSQVLAPHKAGSAKTSCALLFQPTVCVSETSASLAQLIYRSWGSAKQGRGTWPWD